jgi:glycosyltransferase involved in cell wall biosynthesis
MQLNPKNSQKTTWPSTDSIPDFPERMPDGREWPKISIVTPSFNQGGFIEETIRSVVMQGYPNLEYFIIDGGSTDNTIDILKKYDNSITKWVSEPDRGQTHAINKGIGYAKGDIIAYICSDDFYIQGSFKTAALYFAGHPEVAMIYGNLIHINKQGEVIEKVKNNDFDYDQLLSWILYIPQPSTFLRRTVIQEIGLFDEHLDLAMDFDYWIRVGLNHKIHHISEYLACDRVYPETKTLSKYSDSIDEHIYIRDKLFSGKSIPDEILKNKSRYYGSVYYFAARGHLFRTKIISGILYLLRSIQQDPKNAVKLFICDLKKVV